MTEQELADFISDRAGEIWTETKSPFLLTSIATELSRDKGVSYKEILGHERLKEFALRLADRGVVKFVAHPFQKARLGVIPMEADFQFEDSADLPRTQRSKSVPSSHSVLIEFLKALSSLPPEMVDQVVIPTKVLVALADRR